MKIVDAREQACPQPRAFFHTLNEVQPLPTTIIFINSGVRLATYYRDYTDYRVKTIIFTNSGVGLVTEGSKVLDDLCALCDKGVEILACGTCLNCCGLTDKVEVGQVPNMYSIAEMLLQADNVISI